MSTNLQLNQEINKHILENINKLMIGTVLFCERQGLRQKSHGIAEAMEKTQKENEEHSESF